MKIFISILAFLNGGYMLIDGIYVLLRGKYIGPEKPGPWSYLFNRLDVNVVKLGQMFIVFGLLWLLWLCSLWVNHQWAYMFGLIISLLTLWYLPIGTLFSIIIIIVLITYRHKLSI
ncbi:MAG TPA: hypothetical protein VF622_17360 [Segetibacter sp.]|jgi:hypothetical protein